MFETTREVIKLLNERNANMVKKLEVTRTVVEEKWQDSLGKLHDTREQAEWEDYYASKPLKDYLSLLSSPDKFRNISPMEKGAWLLEAPAGDYWRYCFLGTYGEALEFAMASRRFVQLDRTDVQPLFSNPNSLIYGMIAPTKSQLDYEWATTPKIYGTITKIECNFEKE